LPRGQQANRAHHPRGRGPPQGDRLDGEERGASRNSSSPPGVQKRASSGIERASVPPRWAPIDRRSPAREARAISPGGGVAPRHEALKNAGGARHNPASIATIRCLIARALAHLLPCCPAVGVSATVVLAYAKPMTSPVRRSSILRSDTVPLPPIMRRPTSSSPP
jgi:hypothetical protein